MQFRAALFTATMLAAPLALVMGGRADAQPVAGPYVSLGGGWDLKSAVTQKNFNIGGADVPGDAKAVFKNGYDLNASVGYGFNNGWRVELEGDYIRNGADKLKSGGASLGASGHESQYGGFVNGIYDFDVSLPWLYPYLGAGIGWQVASYDKFSAGGATVDQSHGSFAYQGIFGLSFPIAPVVGLSATLEYRFIGLTSARRYDVAGAGQPVSFKQQGEYNNQINVGLRYEFSPPAPPAPAPTPAPVAAPAPAPAKTYLVFFDWDKYSLTPRATQIIAQAASDSKTQNVTTLEVNGYTDTSGAPKYNMGLSIKRAKAVAAQLVADGVPASEIEMHGYGETHLLVPTGPGVREPQNRRVEIIFH
ncbi:OmpA family protein [Acidocella sp.]|uniref:OmpA family protein n=1 Tax=Acidocella sp. TaxID=50710 RepID=UPI003D095664